MGMRECCACNKVYKHSTDGMYFSTLLKKGWYCWKCAQDNVIASNKEDDVAWQVCEVTFEEIIDNGV